MAAYFFTEFPRLLIKLIVVSISVYHSRTVKEKVFDADITYDMILIFLKRIL